MLSRIRASDSALLRPSSADRSISRSRRSASSSQISSILSDACAIQAGHELTNQTSSLLLRKIERLSNDLFIAHGVHLRSFTDYNDFDAPNVPWECGRRGWNDDDSTGASGDGSRAWDGTVRGSKCTAHGSRRTSVVGVRFGVPPKKRFGSGESKEIRGRVGVRLGSREIVRGV